MKKILIVEDELVVRSIYRRKYEMSGYKVETAEEGAGALKMLPDFKPDVIQPTSSDARHGRGGSDQTNSRMAGIQRRADFGPVQFLPARSGQGSVEGGRDQVRFQNGLHAEPRPGIGRTIVERREHRVHPEIRHDPPGKRRAGRAQTSRIQARRHGIAEADGQAGFAAVQIRERSTAGASARTADQIGGRFNFAASEVRFEFAAVERHRADEANFRIRKRRPRSDSRPCSGGASRTGGSAAKPAFFGKMPPAPFKPTTKPVFSTGGYKPPSVPRPIIPEEPAEPATPFTGSMEPTPAEESSDFRVEIRQDFLKRVPLIQNELRERTAALMRSKSTNDQFKLLQDLEISVSSLAGLAGITGFSRVSHLAGSLDALIKDLRKKPAQMTASVLRTIAHAMDCLNVLFRDLGSMPQDVPHSMLILAVDDEPISRRTISVALGKANLRCISMEDSRMALTVLKENAFDLIFLDAEMPNMNGFELCTELRKMPTNKTTPVIFVTSLTKFETRAQSSLSGGSDLIAKPFLMMELAVKALTYLLKPPPSVMSGK